MAAHQVVELWRFPVKSMGGERLDHLGSEVSLSHVARAARCIMISVDQPGVPRDNRILQTIAQDAPAV